MAGGEAETGVRAPYGRGGWQDGQDGQGFAEEAQKHQQVAAELEAQWGMGWKWRRKGRNGH